MEYKVRQKSRHALLLGSGVEEELRLHDLYLGLQSWKTLKTYTVQENSISPTSLENSAKELALKPFWADRNRGLRFRRKNRQGCPVPVGRRARVLVRATRARVQAEVRGVAERGLLAGGGWTRDDAGGRSGSGEGVAVHGDLAWRRGRRVLAELGQVEGGLGGVPARSGKEQREKARAGGLGAAGGGQGCGRRRGGAAWSCGRGEEVRRRAGQGSGSGQSKEKGGRVAVGGSGRIWRGGGAGLVERRWGRGRWQICGGEIEEGGGGGHLRQWRGSRGRVRRRGGARGAIDEVGEAL